MGNFIEESENQERGELEMKGVKPWEVLEVCSRCGIEYIMREGSPRLKSDCPSCNPEGFRDHIGYRTINGSYGTKYPKN